MVFLSTHTIFLFLFYYKVLTHDKIIIINIYPCRPAAAKLKKLGVEFYTFGIRNGNVKVKKFISS